MSTSDPLDRIEIERLTRELGETNEALAACQSEGGGWKAHAERLQARLAKAEAAIKNAGRCLVMSNNGAHEALAVLQRYKRTTDSADEVHKP